MSTLILNDLTQIMVFFNFFLFKFLDFVVVHNGIITNYKEVKDYLIKKGLEFESETDTEVIAKLIQHIHDRYPKFSFRKLVETTIQQLVSLKNFLIIDFHKLSFYNNNSYLFNLRLRNTRF